MPDSIRRMLRRDPVLIFTATLTLAVAIGANTTVFSLVNTVLLRPLPYKDAERIYWVSERMGRVPADGGVGPDYYSLRENRQFFAEIAAYDPVTLSWEGTDRPEQVDAAQASPSFFTVLATRPLLGRTFDESEQGPGAAPVVVLSYPFWRSRLNSDPHAVGRTLRLDGLACTVIGVMPQGFDYPRGAQLWQTLPMDDASQRPRSAMRPMRLVQMIARLKPALTSLQLQAGLPGMARMLRAEYPKELESSGFLDNMAVLSEPLQRRLTGDLRPALYALTGAVLLVLLIACANLANLLLARAAARRRELALRMALGSGRARLVRDMLGESLALALPGGIAGVALAVLAVSTLNLTKPLVLVRYPEIAIDLRTLGFTFALTLLTGLVFGIAPALGAAAVDVQEALKSGGHGQSGSRGARRVRQLLVVAELAVSVVLLIGAGLLARSFVNLARVNLGFPPAGLLTMRANLTGPAYAGAEAQQRYYRDGLVALARLPGVRAAAVSTDLPLTGERPYQGVGFQVQGRAPLPIAQRPAANVTVVSPDFFRTLGVPLRSGALFGAQPRADAIVVNEAFARAVFPGEDPLGRTIFFGQTGRETRWTIGGVVGDVRAGELGAGPEAIAYRCTCQGGSRFLSGMRILVRTDGDAHRLAHAAEAALYAVDRAQPVSDVKTMDERLSLALAPERFNLLLIGVFAGIAVVLSAVGVYGVMAYLVTRRTREIGIRIAIGAQPSQVQRLVLRETAALAVAAALMGVGGAWALTRYLQTMLYGVTALDAVTFAVAPVAAALIALGASLAPARRAAAIDPMVALREE